MAIINFSDTVETIVRDFAETISKDRLLASLRKRQGLSKERIAEIEKQINSGSITTWDALNSAVGNRKPPTGGDGGSNIYNDPSRLGSKSFYNETDRANIYGQQARGAKHQKEREDIRRANEKAEIDHQKYLKREAKKAGDEEYGFIGNRVLMNEGSFLNQLAHYGGTPTNLTSRYMKEGRMDKVQGTVTLIKGAGRGLERTDQSLFGQTYGAAGKKSERLRRKADKLDANNSRISAYTEKKAEQARQKVSDKTANNPLPESSLGKSALQNAVDNLKFSTKDDINKIVNSKVGTAISSKVGEKTSDIVSARADYLRDKANLKDADAHAQARFNKIYKTKNLVTDTFGSIKDSVSEKSRAKTLAERGTVGVRRRDARLAYALGDRSLMTKMYSGHLGGNNPILNRAGRLISNHFRNEEFRNRANYARGISFSELGGIMADLGSRDFDEEVFPPAGEGWQYEEYPMLYNILHDDKYEKFDQKVLQDGQFSENEGEVNSNETPVDGRVIDSDSLRPATNHEQTVEDLLTKNYYDVPFIEKKFQEMIARGFAEESEETEATPYEKFLNDFSDRAESVRRI